MNDRRKLVVLAAALLGAAAAAAPARADSPSGAATAQPVSSSPAPSRDSPAAGAARAPSERALDLFRQANKLYDEGELAAAEARYRQAWELQKTYHIASNFGALELDLGKPAAAAELFAFALQNYPARGKPEGRAGIEARLETARKKVFTLRVKVAGAGAEILIDGRSAGTAPLAGELFLEPGSRTIVARQAGRRDAKQVIRATAGGAQEVTLTLEPLPGPRSEPPARPDPPRRSPIPGVVTGAAGVITLATGAALVGLAESARADAQAKRDALSAAGVSCATPSPGCTELRGLTSRTDTLGNAGIGVMVAGGVLAATGITYLLWPGSSTGPKAGETTLRASIGASPAGGGVTVTGSF